MSPGDIRDFFFALVPPPWFRPPAASPQAPHIPLQPVNFTPPRPIFPRLLVPSLVSPPRNNARGLSQRSVRRKEARVSGSCSGASLTRSMPVISIMRRINQGSWGVGHGSQQDNAVMLDPHPSGGPGAGGACPGGGAGRWVPGGNCGECRSLMAQAGSRWAPTRRAHPERRGAGRSDRDSCRLDIGGQGDREAQEGRAREKPKEVTP